MWALMLLVLKLLMEALYGSPSHTARMIEGPVIHIAHRYGALTGIAYVLVWRCVRIFRFGT